MREGERQCILFLCTFNVSFPSYPSKPSLVI